jgi:uncharacterized protein YndB with AHSA1/START domain
MTEEIGDITTCYTVTFHRRSKHSPARLWRALTDPDELAVWMEAPAKVDPRVGGRYYVDFHGDGESGLDGVIVRMEPARTFAYVWGTSVCEWTIEPSDDGCAYTFVQTGLADRGQGEEGLPAGWHGFLDQLDITMDGGTFDHDEESAKWEQRKPAYAELLDRALVVRNPAVIANSEQR